MDKEAIALYVAAGNPREDWWALDERDRYPYRKMALEMSEKTGLPPEVVRWQRAFEDANGKSAPPVVYWGRGWYLVDGRPKRRAREFAEWAERLEGRRLTQATGA
jgi:glutathione S-transferase